MDDCAAGKVQNAKLAHPADDQIAAAPVLVGKRQAADAAAADQDDGEGGGRGAHHVGGRGDPLGVHGIIVMIYSVALAFVVMAGYYTPKPDPERLSHYYDDPTKFGIVLTMIWAVFGMFFGVWVAALLAWPDLTFDAAWAKRRLTST